MQSQDEFIGKQAGNYRIVRCIGVGGMGAVYMAEHATIGSRVAVKILLPQHVSDSTMVGRFRDEARAVNLVDHPGIVRIHDCDASDEIGVYMIMEFLEGDTLLGMLRKRGPLPPDQVGQIVRQSAAALAVAHRAGIIHRDLKPSNVFLVPDSDVIGGQRVKILDFGIAKLLEHREDIDHNTKTGTIIGSPQYMSPEQCVDAKNVDARTDIYSLGAIAYLLLTGQLPYPAETFGQLLIAQQKGPPPSPSTVRPGTPLALEKLVLKALVVDREGRHASMDELREALDAALAGPEAPVAEPAAGGTGAVDTSDLPTQMLDRGDEGDAGDGLEPRATAVLSDLATAPTLAGGELSGGATIVDSRPSPAEAGPDLDGGATEIMPHGPDLDGGATEIMAPGSMPGPDDDEPAAEVVVQASDLDAGPDLAGAETVLLDHGAGQVVQDDAAAVADAPPDQNTVNVEPEPEGSGEGSGLLPLIIAGLGVIALAVFLITRTDDEGFDTEPPPPSVAAPAPAGDPDPELVRQIQRVQAKGRLVVPHDSAAPPDTAPSPDAAAPDSVPSPDLSAAKPAPAAKKKPVPRKRKRPVKRTKKKYKPLYEGDL